MNILTRHPSRNPGSADKGRPSDRARVWKLPATRPSTSPARSNGTVWVWLEASSG